jgi:predicted Zn-dependent protease
VDVHEDAYRASFNLGKLLLRSGRAREAAEAFRTTVEIRPQFGTGHLYLAKALLDAGDLAAAEEAAHRGLDLAPEPGVTPLGHFVLADVYSRLGRPREAEREAAAGRRLQGTGGR